MFSRGKGEIAHKVAKLALELRFDSAWMKSPNRVEPASAAIR